MAKKFPIHPKHPERLCWGCDKYCPADSLACGNGSERTQHPVELFGDDWHEWGIDAVAGAAAAFDANSDPIPNEPVELTDSTDATEALKATAPATR